MKAKVRLRNEYLPFANDEWEKLEHNWSLVVSIWRHREDDRFDIVRLDTSIVGLQYNFRSFIRYELEIQ